MSNKTVAIYVRQSIDKKDSLSIEGQIELCQKQCDAHESILTYSDRGYSGKNTNRPSFEKMISDVKNGKIQKIIVYRLDRFSRSITDFSRIWSQLEEHGVEFVSVNERFDTTTPMGKAMLYIIMIFAQLERETIAERVKDNYYQRSKKGNWPGGPAPFGFKNDRITCQDGSRIPTLVTTDEIEIVKRIYHEYAMDDVSLGSIAKQLTEENVACRKRAFWDNVALSRILHSPLYVQADSNVYMYYCSRGVKIANDLEEYDGTASAHIVGKRTASERKYTKLKDHVLSLTNFEGIIPSDIWLKCQHKLEQNTQIKNTGKGKYTWLSGYIKCGKCGYALTVKCARDGRYYLGCSGHAMHTCDVTSFYVSLDEIENAITAEIEEVICKSKDIDLQIDETSTGDNEKQLLADIEKKIKNLTDALAEASPVSMKYINKEMEQLDSQKSIILERCIFKSDDRKKYEDIEFSKLSFEDKKLVLGSYIDKILILGDSVDVVWKV